MATVEITADNFKDTIEKGGIVLLDFWAEWCGPCRAFAPVFEKASDTHGDVVFGKIDTEAQQELAGAAGIQAIPTLMLFRDGILLFRESRRAAAGRARGARHAGQGARHGEGEERDRGAPARSTSTVPDCNHDHDHEHGHGPITITESSERSRAVRCGCMRRSTSCTVAMCSRRRIAS